MVLCGLQISDCGPPRAINCPLVKLLVNIITLLVVFGNRYESSRALNHTLAPSQHTLAVSRHNWRRNAEHAGLHILPSQDVSRITSHHTGETAHMSIVQGNRQPPRQQTIGGYPKQTFAVDQLHRKWHQEQGKQPIRCNTIVSS